MNTILSFKLDRTSFVHHCLYKLFLFVKTKAYPYIPAGMFSGNLNSTLTGWAFSKFF